jgi:hypothetical protein
MLKPSTRGTLIASAVASMFAMASVASANLQGKEKQASKTVKCEGANACKGKSACKSAQNDCKGKNACKGKGFINTKNEADCKKKGGTVAAGEGQTP